VLATDWDGLGVGDDGIKPAPPEGKNYIPAEGGGGGGGVI